MGVVCDGETDIKSGKLVFEVIKDEFNRKMELKKQEELIQLNGRKHQLKKYYRRNISMKTMESLAKDLEKTRNKKQQ